MKGIVFFDLDGTLLDNSRGIIPESTLQALDELRKGYIVALSTGRDMDSHYSVKWKKLVAPDVIIHMNGTKITIGDRLLFEHYMDKKLLSRIYDFSLEADICFGTTILDRDYYTIPEKKTRADLAFTREIKRNYRPFSELIDGDVRIHALSYAGDLAKDKPVIEEAFPELELLGFDSGAGADVVEKGVSKAEGLRRVCEHYGIDRSHTYAFGDSQNDLMIIKEAGVGVAMGNAVPELKERADLVTDPIWDDGIYKACVRLGLIGGSNT